MISSGFNPVSPYVVLPDGTKATWFDSRGNVQVAIQDQFTQFFDFRLAKTLGSSTIATDTSINSKSITVADASSATAGNYVAIFPSPFGYNTEIYVGKILSKALNVISLDTPINRVFQIGDVILYRDPELHLANGSITPQIYALFVPAGNIQLDLTRIMIVMECSTAPDDSLFGNLTALTNGIVLRHNSTINGIRNIWNAKTNGDLAEIAYDVLYTDKAGAGHFAVRCLITLNAQRFHGVTVRMVPGDAFEIVIQDDLTALLKFHVIAQGHVVD